MINATFNQQYSSSWAVQVIPELLRLAQKAGDAIMDIYAQDFKVTLKSDHTPVTAADHAAEAIIMPVLASLTPDLVVISEEAFGKLGVPDNISDCFWLVDPLDGTREFMSKNGEFTVNIAFIDQTRPVLGVIYAPALDVFYWGVAGQGAWKKQGKVNETLQIFTNSPDIAGHVLISSRRHGDLADIQKIIGDVVIKDHVYMGSSLKFCLLAEGRGDVYPRIGRTMEWDTAAGQAILEAAGGQVQNLDGSLFTYQKNAGFENPSFLAWGKSNVLKVT